MLDFDSCSNSSQVSNSCSSAGAAGGTGGQDNDQAVVYGPTTRRQWNEYVKRPQSHSQSGTENDDSSVSGILWHLQMMIRKLTRSIINCNINLHGSVTILSSV